MKEQEGSLEKLVLAITPDPFAYLNVPEVEDFVGSNLATYMSMLMYRNMGDASNASVDYRRLQNNAGVYASAVSEDELSVEKGKARINLVSFEGITGKKVSFTASCTTGDVTHVISWPWFVPRESEVASVTLKCSNGESVTTSILEDYNKIAQECLAMTVKAAYLKSFYRGFTKVTAAKVAADEALELAIKAADEAYKKVSTGGNFLVTKAAAVARDTAVKTAYATRNAAL